MSDIDVILSPMKPRQKVVTAEDVASSLYYLHVNGPEDESLLQSSKDDYEEGIPEQEEPVPELPSRPAPSIPVSSGLPDALRPGVGHIKHHPLPPLPPYPLDDGPPPPVPLHGNTERKPVATIPRKPAPTSAIPARKPVNSQARGVASSAPEFPRRRLIDQPSGEATSSSTSPRPYLAQRPTMSTLASPYPDQAPEVTVIRRNPASGEQWNIGTISDPPVFDIASSSDGRRGSGGMTSTRIRRSGQPVYLRISNPGYHKFTPPSSDGRIGGHSTASSTPSLAYSDAPTEDSNTLVEPSFTRRMWLEGSLFEKTSQHRKSLSADHAEHNPNYLSPRPTFTSTSSYSGQSLGPNSAEDDIRRLSLTGDTKRSHTRGYTFLSPWNGRCEFATGTMGNSLKCRHLRVGKNSLNPGSDIPELISELRFNLPGGGPLASDQPRRRSPGKSNGAQQKESRRSRLLAKLSDRDRGDRDKDRNSYSYDEQEGIEDSAAAVDEQARLDLSLGQELAGGGFAGKQAKLGKLIVQGEGLQMLDLVVSANMALWMRAWEKFAFGV